MANASFNNPKRLLRVPSPVAHAAFQKALVISALLLVIVVLAIMLSLAIHSFPSLKAFGFTFFFSKTWDPVSGRFGALVFLIGTLLTSFLALLICLPFSLAIGIFIGEYHREGIVSSFLKQVTELLAGIPSVIYGFWGLFVFVPVVRNLEMKLGVLPYGVGIFAASVILSVMVVPYAASIGREVISMVPSDIKEAGYALGATRQEVVTKIILPYARSGILAGILLALGRALGETMAVTMVIGNANIIPRSIFSPGNTMASVIANEFTEATGELYLSSLIQVGLLLFLVAVGINILGRYIIKKVSIEA
jgi:phosphate transport system permease protein